MNILDTIIEYKREEVKRKKSIVRIADLEKRKLFSRAVLPLKDFLLDRSRTGIIAEFKRIKHLYHGADQLKNFDAEIICKRLLVIDNLIQLQEFDQIFITTTEEMFIC